MPYFVMLKDGADYEINLVEFAVQLKQRWPMIEFRQSLPGETVILEWTIRNEVVCLDGQLQDRHGTLVLDEYPAAIAEFAVWYRNFIPDQYRLFVYHDSDAELEVEIRNDSRPEDIIRGLSG